jgi:hypothetical protein
MTAIEIREDMTHLQALALTAFGEARGDGYRGLVAVCWSARNRLARPQRFGATYKAVVHARAQYSCWWPYGGVGNYAAVMAAAKDVVMGVRPAQGSPLALAFQAAVDVIEDRVIDPTNGATHYYMPAEMKPPGRVPIWAAPPAQLSAELGGHRFYTHVA